MTGGTLRIASGWIRSAQLHAVITDDVAERIKSGAISLRLLLRIGNPTDVEITDGGVFRFLEDLADAPNADVQWRYSSHHHSKMYIVDTGWAMVGSFNLTGGGFGTESRPGSNPEAGIITTKKREITALTATFDQQFADAQEVPTDLVGFVANAAHHNGFSAILTQPVAAGTFVQVPTDNPARTILAQVEDTLRLHQSFFSAGDDPVALNPDIFRRFATGSTRSNLINGLAFSADAARNQLSIVALLPIRIIERTEGSAEPVFQPVGLPPAVGAPVSLAEPDILHTIFNPQQARYAHLEENPAVSASFDNRQVLTKHLAVLGSTGSGKSYFTKRYIERSLVHEAIVDKRRKGAPDQAIRIVLVDTHGEYGPGELDASVSVTNVLADEAAIKRATATPVTDVDDLMNEIPALGKQDVEILNQAFAAAGHESDGEKKRDAFRAVLTEEIERRSQSDHAAVNWPNVLEDLRDAYQAEEKKPSNDPLAATGWQYAADIASLTHLSDGGARNRLKTLITNKHIQAIKSAVGAPKRTEVDTAGLQAVVDALGDGGIRLETLELISKLQHPGVYRLDLQSVHDPETRQALVGDLMKEVFERAKSTAGSNGFRTLFVVDEAQNYAPERSSKTIPSFRWMKVIASEGRKFGVGLLVMTQRPTYLSKDILAQCNSQAIFRLINKGDLDQVANTVEGISESDLEQIPQFVAGQAIFTGVGMTMPVRVRVEA